jgi:hypothetical protein
VGKCQRVDNNVKVSLTFTAPIIRQMATSSIIPPSTATIGNITANTVTDTHHKVRLALGTSQKVPNLKLRKNFLALSQSYKK